jgi:N-acetylmuramoyl-L-alanine amidase
MALYRHLSGEFAVELYDCGALTQSEYDDAKVARVNQCKPSLALELHCNAGPPKANYFEAIYAKYSPAKEAAEHVVEALAEGYKSQGLGHWKNNGARCDDRGLFFLQRTIVPCVIVEGLFISNDDQAKWLVTGGNTTGQDLYGTFVANGIKRWLKAHS